MLSTQVSWSTDLKRSLPDFARKQFIVRVSVIDLVIFPIKQSINQIRPGIRTKSLGENTYCVIKVGKKFLSFFVVEETIEKEISFYKGLGRCTIQTKDSCLFLCYGSFPQ